MSFEDIAQEQELLQWTLRNEAPRKPIRFTPVDAGYGNEFCDCGEEVATPRRELGYHACIACATKAEHNKKLFGR